MCGPGVVSIITLFSAYMRISKIAITYCYLYLTCMWLYLDVSSMKKTQLISHYNITYLFWEFFVCFWYTWLYFMIIFPVNNIFILCFLHSAI